MATLKRLGCHFSSEQHLEPTPKSSSAIHPLQVLGNLTVPKEPGTGTAQHNRQPWRDGRSCFCPWHSLPQHTDRHTAGSGRGRHCLQGEQSTRGTNLCHMPPLPVRDLSATRSAQLLVWFGLVLCCAQDRLCPFLRSGSRTCPAVLLNLPCAHPPAGLSCCWRAQSQWDRDGDGLS